MPRMMNGVRPINIMNLTEVSAGLQVAAALDAATGIGNIQPGAPTDIGAQVARAAAGNAADSYSAISMNSGPGSQTSKVNGAGLMVNEGFIIGPYRGGIRVNP